MGGGTGGVMAAIAAARAGAKVTVIEQEPFVGGTITMSYVAMPCGRPRNGLYQQMLERLHARFPLPAGPNWFLPSSWLGVMNEMLAEAGVRVLCGVREVAPLMENAGGRARGRRDLAGSRRHGRYGRRPTIDATGTGEFAEAAGCETLYGTDSKPTSTNRSRRIPVPFCAALRGCISQKMGNVPAFDMTIVHQRRIKGFARMDTRQSGRKFTS